MAASKNRGGENGKISTGRKWLLIVLVIIIIALGAGLGIIALGGGVLLALIVFVLVNRYEPPKGKCPFCKTSITQDPKSTDYTECHKCGARLKWVI
jgi:hypothetical protein